MFLIPKNFCNIVRFARISKACISRVFLSIKIIKKDVNRTANQYAGYSLAAREAKKSIIPPRWMDIKITNPLIKKKN
ncbi:hypothetical protein D3C71_1339070 [compost metagenome]